MPTITVKLDKKRAARLTRWARHRKVPKSDVIRALIDRAGPIETGEDLIVVEAPNLLRRLLDDGLAKGHLTVAGEHGVVAMADGEDGCAVKHRFF